MGKLTMAAVAYRLSKSQSIRMKQNQTIKAGKPSPIAGAGGSGTLSASGFMVALVMMLQICATSSTSAQAAANFDPKTLSPEAPVAKEEKPAKPLVTEVAPIITTPSRQVGPNELEAYLSSLSSVFVSRGRTLDPFGMPQDPDAKPVVKAPVPGAIKRPTQIQATPFPEIVQKIVVTTIMPGEKRFLVGTRSFKQGEQMPLSFRGKLIPVQITEVTSQQISFKNLESGEMASRKLDMLPVGMTPGSRGISAPGMTADRPNAPIELESSETAP